MKKRIRDRYAPVRSRTMKKYTPEKLVRVSRYRKLFGTLSPEIQQDTYRRMRDLLIEERPWCDRGNYLHIAQILTTIALYEVLQRHGKSEPETFRTISEAMWAELEPRKAFFRRLARLPFCLSLMKKILPIGFRKGSGAGWKYTWHTDGDPKDRFRFECHECLYRHIFGERGLMKLGAMFCHSDMIAFGNLPYTDFRRTMTLCQGGDRCDFEFVRHPTDAGDGWERFPSI